ncbi:MAG TPA: hypothetical protein VHP31_10530, partial [Caproicibacter sp.]|nr:hypothetical protein [Caproicibacter sp.]
IQVGISKSGVNAGIAGIAENGILEISRWMDVKSINRAFPPDGKLQIKTSLTAARAIATWSIIFGTLTTSRTIAIPLRVSGFRLQTCGLSPT